ncbi:hypothetical protein AMTRI_Chr10g8360 [Amborella trichopoda]|uniref:GPI-anchored protein LLG1-like domain-containing protein n=1 Tax=Amborella trichopoda TaxID=13333 RepID=U5D0B9_AMBTC|nr:GPI-anchored protein LLG1 [Amborella trichopoda]ERN19026.1 hypothetical protein AMTR_s00061p00060650 [Amborella trichopoda]|eukprot:XP_006857559.1 GPI-anchored protein LLG1 [Amborella trichopoda]
MASPAMAFCCSMAAVFSFLFIGFASSTSISDNVFESHGVTGRSLLQEKKNCPEDFEFKNYTILTSQCKGPRYQPSLCCSAFKQFACPFAQLLNDDQYACASTMFSYINLRGGYPPGLFSSECREGKLGLACPPMPAPSQGDSANEGQMRWSFSLLWVLSVSLVVFFFV